MTTPTEPLPHAQRFPLEALPPTESAPSIETFDAFLTVLAFGLGAAIDAGTTVATPLGDVGLDSLGLLLVSIGLAEHGADLTDDDWLGLQTVGRPVGHLPLPTHQPGDAMTLAPAPRA